MPILVAGAHRSGTSAVTRALFELGLSSGTDLGIIGPNESQPHGHHEAIEVVAINDRLLRALGGNWIGLPGEAHNAVAALADGPIGDEARALVREHLPGSDWVVKDPRFSVLLPFWRIILSDDFGLVVCCRNPLAVAQSLTDRDAMPFSLGLGIWQSYNHALLRDSDDLSSYALGFEKLTKDPSKVLSGLLPFIEKHTGVDCSSRIDVASKSIDASATRSARAKYPLKLSTSSQRLFDYLKTRHGKSLGTPPFRPTRPATALIDSGIYAGRIQFEQSAIVNELTGELSVSNRSLDDTKAHVATLGEQIGIANNELATVQTQLQEQDAEVARVHGEVAHAQSELERAHDEHAIARNEFDEQAKQLQAIIDQKDQALSAMGKQLESIQAELVAAGVEHRELTDQLHASETQGVVVDAQLRLALLDVDGARAEAAKYVAAVNEEQALVASLRHELTEIRASRSYQMMRRYSLLRTTARTFKSRALPSSTLYERGKRKLARSIKNTL